MVKVSLSKDRSCAKRCQKLRRRNFSFPERSESARAQRVGVQGCPLASGRRAWEPRFSVTESSSATRNFQLLKTLLLAPTRPVTETVSTPWQAVKRPLPAATAVPQKKQQPFRSRAKRGDVKGKEIQEKTR